MLGGLRERGLHHIRLAEWFRLSFVDGYGWVLLAGMSQWADGGAGGDRAVRGRRGASTG